MKREETLTSRAWSLRGVKTLDLVTRDGVDCSGGYAMSVLTPD